jgi:hypothetical protein
MRDRVRPEGSLPDTHAYHASMHSQRHTLSADNRENNFRVFSRRERLSGPARLSRAPKDVRCGSKAPSCSASHVLLRSSRRILGAPTLSKVRKYFGGGGMVQEVLERPRGPRRANSAASQPAVVLLRCLCGVGVSLMV